MTYLDLVNDVLIRLREDKIDTVGVNAQTELSDPVAFMVKQFVNDAKRAVEDAHTWNALRNEWSVTTSASTATYSLTGAGESAIMDVVYDADGNELSSAHLNKVRKDGIASSNNRPSYYAVDGMDASRDVKVRFAPVPDAAYSYTFYGYGKQADLQTDTDECLVPHKPVVYLALALAARERGEVGGQTAAEIFSVAKQYLSDAIAYDAALSQEDDIWFTI